jgi:hypothetical protein
MGLHPWEFFRYSFKQFIAKRKGFYQLELREWHRTRFVAFSAASSAGLLKKGTTLQKFCPLPGDNGKRKVNYENLKKKREILLKTEPPKGIRNGRSAIKNNDKR